LFNKVKIIDFLPKHAHKSLMIFCVPRSLPFLGPISSQGFRPIKSAICMFKQAFGIRDMRTAGGNAQACGYAGGQV
jgi:hypothetical protein